MSPAENDWLWIAWRQLWQVTVLIAAVALLSRLVAAHRPHLAFALWLVVLLKCLTPPLWSSPTGAFCWLQPAPRAVARELQGTAAVVLMPAGTAPASSRADAGSPPADGDGQNWCSVLEALHPAALLTAIWGVGIAVALAAMAAEWRGIAKLVRLADAETSAPYVAMLADLSRRLEIRRRVRLVVSDSPVGPAVFGLRRPTVLLPKAAIEGRAADEIELMIAHELMHIRHGDLGIALLRSLVFSLWWFHPLVWWAARRASREAERCCDDAVLAELRCSPIRYARCLLGILEIKQRLAPAPAFPGVRAAEVTQGRLERIMRIGQRGYRRTPWWCWAVGLLVAVAVLPGAALRISAGEGADPGQPRDLPPGVAAPPVDSRVAVAVSAAARADAGLAPPGYKPSHLTYMVTYSADDVLAKIREERKLSPAKAQAFLLGRLKNFANVVPQVDAEHRDVKRIMWIKGVKGDRTLLLVEATQAGHERIAGRLEAFRQWGTAEIAIVVRFVTGPAKETERSVADWTTFPWSPVPAQEAVPASAEALQHVSVEEHPVSSREFAQAGRAETVIEKSRPVRCRIVDEALGAKLIDHWQADKRTNVLQSPKVTVLNGQTALVSDRTQSPFVVGMHDDDRGVTQPQIRVVSEGVTMRLRPLTDRSAVIRLEFGVTVSEIRSVETAMVSMGVLTGSGKPASIQVPEVATTRVECGVALGRGQWLLLLLNGRELREHADQRSEPQSMIVMLRAEKVEDGTPGRREGS